MDSQQAADTLQAVENKISLLFRFLGDEDDDVSAAVATFTTDYISLLKQMDPLSQKQRENIEVCAKICDSFTESCSEMVL